MILKLITLIVSAVLFWWGGYNWLPARRFIMPSVITVTTVIITHWWWALLLMLPPMSLFLSLGYGPKSEFYYLFGDGCGRGVWGLLVGIAASLGLCMAGHLQLYWFIPYLAVSFTLENLLKSLPQDEGDPIIGLGFASIMLLIR